MFNKFFQSVVPPPVLEATETLATRYQQHVAQQHLCYDAAQLAALSHLQDLLDHLLLVAHYDSQSYLHKLVVPAPPKAKSVYLYGDVGRGKSMLMSLFYEACPIEQKQRLHFNCFMLEVHAFIHECRQTPNTDAISALAQKIRANTLLLCLDEFHVTDIADAMILERLFGKLFDLGLYVVFTSNRHPDDLYQGGLQREQFLLFSKRLQAEAHTIELLAATDYRLMHLRSLETRYYYPLGDGADAFIQHSYDELSNFAVREAGVLTVLGRELKLTAVHGDVALSSFAELCATPLGPADYNEIANEFGAVILADIPQLGPEKRNEAKRFMLLIDALYEHKVKLVCTAEVAPAELYTQGDGAFEFQRTVSRLMEMQAESYLQSPHNAA